MNSPSFYILATVFMVISAIFLPFWLTGIIFVVSVFLLDNFFAGLVVLFAMDAVYGFETYRLGSIHGILTISGILAYLIIQYLKESTLIRNR